MTLTYISSLGLGVNLRNSNLEGSMLALVNLRVSTLKNANLRNCDLRMSVLAGADLEVSYAVTFSARRHALRDLSKTPNAQANKSSGTTIQMQDLGPQPLPQRMIGYLSTQTYM